MRLKIQISNDKNQKRKKNRSKKMKIKFTIPPLRAIPAKAGGGSVSKIDNDEKRWVMNRITER